MPEYDVHQGIGDVLLLGATNIEPTTTETIEWPFDEGMQMPDPSFDRYYRVTSVRIVRVLAPGAAPQVTVDALVHPLNRKSSTPAGNRVPYWMTLDEPVADRLLDTLGEAAQHG